jgi:hypothetical protein
MPIYQVPEVSAAGLQPKYQKFTSSGTFTLPTGYGAGKPLLVNIQVIGGGGGGSADTANNFNASWVSYFGEGPFNSGTVNGLGRAGGSGGIAATQMYLTSNLSITVGAAGTRLTSAVTGNNANSNSGNNSFDISSSSATAGTGGTTTAGSVQATGGVGGNQSTNAFFNRGGYSGPTITSTTGAGGTPAGTAGAATPLLGTIAGGANSTTPVRGSFGIGGVSTDGATSTGVEGTGGGATSVGASGAVILTWWE